MPRITPIRTRVEVLKLLFEAIDANYQGGVRQFTREKDWEYEMIRRWKLGMNSPRVDMLQDVCDDLGLEIVLRPKHAPV
jgi:hypothetical protein